MIDIESEVFGTIAPIVRTTHDAFVSGEYIDVPAKFPAVSIIQADNTVYKRMRTSNIENAVKVLFEVNVYSNTVGKKKSEAKAIMATIDDEFEKLGFTRTMCNPVSNLQDATIFRLFARYEAYVDKDLWIYTG